MIPDGRNEGGKPLKIVTTVFPAYDWVRSVLGENPGKAEIVLLTDNGVDIHSFQPSVDDILKISSCDLFLYVGGESDEWVEDALKEAQNPNQISLSLLDLMGETAKEEEEKEGMQEERGGEEEGALDEHVWLSIKNASFLSEKIEEAISALDPANAERYAANEAALKESLAALDQEFEDAVSKGSFHTLLFADRFPLRYLTDDYGLDYYAAFAGCSAETEASFETITFLAKKLDELHLPVVLTIEGSDQKLAKTVVQSTKTKDQKILMFHSMQSVTANMIQEGADYLKIMQENLEILKEAMN